jgi:hypothetical protein
MLAARFTPASVALLTNSLGSILPLERRRLEELAGKAL